jgi:hypothetical protein
MPVRVLGTINATALPYEPTGAINLASKTEEIDQGLDREATQPTQDLIFREEVPQVPADNVLYCLFELETTGGLRMEDFSRRHRDWSGCGRIVLPTLTLELPLPAIEVCD